MSKSNTEEEFVEARATYTLDLGDRFVIIENVPVRISQRTGERFFSPATVERLQGIIWEEKRPSRVIETPVFEFSEHPA